MPNPWFRLYSEFADDPKVQILSEAMQRRLIMLFCLRCKRQLSSCRPEQIAWALRISEQELQITKEKFVDAGFIDDSWTIVHWDDRQFENTSTERVRRYRERREAKGMPKSSNHLSDPFLYRRDGNRCIYCGNRSNLCIDHIYPITLGGTDDYDNLGVACKACNSGKSGRTPEQAKYQIIDNEALIRYERFVSKTSATVTETARTDTEQNRTEQKKPLQRGTRLPEDFSPDESDKATAVSLKVDLAYEFEKFRDYFIAAPGQKGVKTNWHSTLKNWLRTAAERGSKNPLSNGHHPVNPDRYKREPLF